MSTSPSEPDPPHSIAPGNADFAPVWQTLGLEDVAGRIELAHTLTAQTLMALRDTEAKSPANDAAVRDPIERRESIPALPRISLRYATSPTSLASPTVTHGDESEPDLRLIGVLGEGGMGRVHLARQSSLRRDVAVKTMKSDVVSVAAVEALLVEAFAMGSLEHPNIPPVHALGRDAAGLPVLVMKRIEGVEWSALLHAPDDPRWARIRGGADSDKLMANLEVLLQVCNAVQYAHSRGVIHRDIKPENVMIGEFGEVYLVDWGIAVRSKGTGSDPGAVPDRTPSLVGTPVYMAPEMVASGPIDARTDVYLLGATLHELLVGTPRHAAATLHEALMSAFESEPHAYGADVPGELADLCNRASARDPEARFADALGFRRALEEYLAHRASIALTDVAREKLRALRLLESEAAEADDRRWYELSSESRFGFVQALGGWAQNASARAGFQECLEVMAEHEIARGHLAAASAMVAELPEPRPALAERLARLRIDVERRVDRERQLSEIERDRDVSVAAGPRAAFLVIVIVALLAISLASTHGGEAHVAHKEALTFSVLGNALMAVLALVFRRSLLRTAFNRQIFWTLALVGVVMTLHRAAGWAASMPVSTILAGDLLVIGGASVTCAVYAARWIGWLAAVMLAGAVAAFLRPAMAADIFTASSVSGMVLAITLFRRYSTRPVSAIGPKTVRDDPRRA